MKLIILLIILVAMPMASAIITDASDTIILSPGDEYSGYLIVSNISSNSYFEVSKIGFVSFDEKYITQFSGLKEVYEGKYILQYIILVPIDANIDIYKEIIDIYDLGVEEQFEIKIFVEPTWIKNGWNFFHKKINILGNDIYYKSIALLLIIALIIISIIIIIRNLRGH